MKNHSARGARGSGPGAAARAADVIADLIAEATRGRQAEDEDMVKAPCKDCTKREVGCRSSCEAWTEYQIRKTEDAELRRKAEGRMKQADAYVRQKRRRSAPWHDGRQVGRLSGRSESKDKHRSSG